MDEPRFELGLEGGDTRRPKPGWPSRLLEGAGLVALLFGFAAWQPVWIVAGICAITLSYVVYRKRHGRFGAGRASERGGGYGIDGGGDGGGGD